MPSKTKFSILATALTGAALIAPAAQARPIDAPGLPVAGSGSSAPAPVVSHIAQQAASADSGFDWGDAGIGAGVTLSVLGLGVAATGLARRTSTRPAVS
jgi:hypothetical protein